MARMFPERFPATSDPRRKSERVVYEAARTRLDDKWTVFYSVAWLGYPGRNRDAQTGEVDFAFAHPEHGLLLVEVKGGAIRFDANSGTWTSTDRSGKAHRIKDPFRQVDDAMYSLIRKLKEHRYWRTSNRRVCAGRAVCFPSVRGPERDLRLDAPKETVLYRSTLDDLQPALIAALERWSATEGWRHERLGQGGVRALESLFARSVHLPITLGMTLAETDEHIIELTDEQTALLGFLSRARRVGVSGGAGTGKTMLAVEKARRLANEGHRTLLTCYNIPLCLTLKDQLRNVENLVVETFHGVCADAADQMGIDLTDPYGPQKKRPQSFYDVDLPNAFATALELGYPRFDAIVADEGQDFHEEWWLSLQMALNDADQGIIYVFYDRNQGIYSAAGGDFVDGLVPAVLEGNLRNTQAIHQFADEFQAGEPPPCRGPEGVPIELIEADADATPSVVRSILMRWIHDEHVAPPNIAVLCCRKVESLLPGFPECLGSLPVTRDLGAARTKVLVETVHRFKGLERQAVVLVLPHKVDRPKIDPLLYVGSTRAGGHLAVVGPEIPGGLA